jgi:hypothetical protein
MHEYLKDYVDVGNPVYFYQYTPEYLFFNIRNITTGEMCTFRVPVGELNRSGLHPTHTEKSVLFEKWILEALLSHSMERCYEPYY